MINIFKISIFLIFLICLISSPISVYAQSGCGQVPCSASCPSRCPTREIHGTSCYCLGTKPVLKIGDYTIDSPVYFTDVGDIISTLLPYVFVIAGLILFFLLVTKGLQYLTSGGDPKKVEGAKQGLTAALVGFLIIFISYWLIQIAEFVLHINILGSP